MNSRLIPAGMDSVGGFLFYSLPLNVSSRGQFYFETVNNNVKHRCVSDILQLSLLALETHKGD